MAKISSFDQTTISVVIDDMMTELRSLEKKYGVKFGRKSATYSPGSFRMSITCEIAEENRAKGVLTKEEQTYNQMKTRNGLPDLGFQYQSSDGKTMTVVGWNSRGRKYPIQLKGSDGRTYKCSVESLSMQARVR